MVRRQKQHRQQPHPAGNCPICNLDAQHARLHKLLITAFWHGSVPTHVVGRTLLKKEWGPAGNDPAVATGDKSPTFSNSHERNTRLLKRVPRWMVLERALPTVSLRRAQ